MKKISILASLLIAMTSSLFSQDRDPSPFRFTFFYDGKLYRDTCLNQDIFKQKKFVLGAQWGMHPKMARALHMSVNQGTQPVPGGNPDEQLYRNPFSDYKLYHIWDNRRHDPGMGFVFEPTLLIPPDKRGQFITKPNDTTRAIWGFSDIRATIPSSTADPEFDRLKLINYLHADTVVLKNSWPQDLYYYNPTGTPDEQLYFHGRSWIISVNLRYLDSNLIKSGSDAAITIRMPYRMRTGKDTWAPIQYIKFFAQPNGAILDTMRFDYYENLGIGYKWSDTTTRSTEFKIPFNLIPDKMRRANYGFNRDVTISAVLKCDGQLIIGNNPFLWNSPGDTSYYDIDQMDIEVTYNGGADIGINWIRVCTPETYDHFIGKYDRDHRDWAQRALDTIRAYGYENYLVYTQDEHGPQRYSGISRYSKQYNGAIVAEGSGWMHHKYGENAAHNWTGCSNMDLTAYAPYVFLPNFFNYEGIDRIYRMGLLDDNRTSSGAVNFKDIETKFDGDSFWVSWRDTTKWTSTGMTASYAYFGRLREEQSYQIRIENADIMNYYHSQGYIYDGTPWWANNFPMGGWGGFRQTYLVRRDTTVVWNPITYKNDTTIVPIYDDLLYPRIGWNRPQTGEEVRWHIWNRLIFGAKGLMYDAHCQSFLNDSSNTLSLGFLDVRPEYISCFDTASTETLLYKEDPVFGVDFIPPVDSATKVTNNFNRDSTGKYLGTGPDRIYYGRKSPKLEMLKAHTYIRAVDSLLMDMRLVATFSKGIRIWENADTAHGYAANILDSIIRLDRRWIIYDPNDSNKTIPSDIGIRTRPLGRMNGKEEHFEPYDSTFVDITLHRQSNDPNLYFNFIIGVQNRRVNPLLYFPDSTYMSFWATAELEDSCRYSSNPRLWKERYWQRLGTREVRIPFYFTKALASNDKTLLRISELGYEDSTLRAQWWRQPDYCHAIDTIISRDGELVLRMLPGEGKLLKVEVCNQASDITGNLDRSNQRKIVGYPIIANENLSQTGPGNFPMKYHTVYYKNNVGIPPRSRVFYMGSVSISRRFPYETLLSSGHETRLFDSVRVLNRRSLKWDTIFDPECKYPSIVVRYDSTTQKAKAYISAVITALPADVDSLSYGENMVVEAILTNLVDFYPSYVSMPEVIAHVAAGRDRKITDFGIPTINASAEGNFYAWADSLQGIRVGFKRPNETQFNPNNILSFRWFQGNNSRAVDPSVNTYSKLRWGENDCSVAWAETPSWRFGDTNSHIYYTQIYWDGRSLERKIPKKDAYIFWSSYNTDSTMIWLSEKPQMNNPDQQTRQNRFPVIYRAIDENTDLCMGCPPLLQTLERVYWQGKDIQFDPWNPRRAVFYIAIDQHDSVYNNKWSPKDWSVQTLFDIMSPTKSLYFPDAAQGRMVGRYARTDSALHLNFVSISDSSSPDIWHISHDWWTMMGVEDFPTLMNNFEEYKYARKVGPGVYPHLAAIPYVYDESFRWYNRRIFNAGFPPANQPIKSTVNYVFNKEGIGDNGEERFYAFFGYRLDSSLRVTHTLPIIKNIDDEAKAIGFSKEIDVKTLSTRDTLYSDWFKLDDINFVSFLQASGTNNKSTYIIEKRGGKKIEFGKLPMPEKQINKRKMILTKGGGKEYRFLWIKPQGAQYFEEGVIGNFESASETVEGLNKVGVESDSEVEVIDLGENALAGDNSLEAFPNPAQDELYFNGPSDENVEVYDLLGQCVGRYEKLSDRRINISGLPVGMYILKVGSAQTKFIKR